ncbi:MAG: two-component system sensor histidine kinase CreC [Chromatiales bacterium]|nr:two-component system sensor histidine kinase CreC [Chromatiales bacterium]
MNLSVRIFLGYFLLLGLAVWFVMRTFNAELVPGMRQSLEEVLVDSANLIAEIVRDEVAAGEIADGRFAGAMEAFVDRHLEARIWFLKKRDPNLIVYITDKNGIVIYDSRGRDLGSDYSRWNDVYLTLHGEYGARTTRDDENDPYSSVMYVAAPIRHAGEIIGVVTVAKPSVTVQPFVERARRNIEEKGILLLLGAITVGFFITYWLTFSIRKLTDYAQAVRSGKRVAVPRLREKELAQLAGAMEAMRSELEGKDYVEHYLHTLTHELKSPLAAIRGAAELLDEEMALEDRRRFVANIRNESERLQQVVEQLLGLAALEKRQGLEQVEAIDISKLLRQLCEDKTAMLQPKGIKFETDFAQSAVIAGERFLIQQALSNLIDNAIAFSPQGGEISLTTQIMGNRCEITITDQGPGIPDYARERVFDRFYSLPRPDGSARSSGLGLSFVKEVALLHGGEVKLLNGESGVVATLYLPIS